MNKKFEIKCLLCGNKINILDEEKIGCAKCPSLLKNNCNMIKCNNCGYEFIPSDPKLINFIKKTRKKNK